MPKSGEHRVNNIDSFFRVRPSSQNLREGELVSFLEDGKLVKQEKRNGVVYEQVFAEQQKLKQAAVQTTGDVTNLIIGGSTEDADITGITAGTGLSGGGASGNITLNIDSTVTTLTGSQTLTNKTLTSPVINTGVSGTAILDENNMASDSDTKLATQQSIKAYVDSEISGIAAPANATITLSPGAGLAAIGDFTTNQSSNETLTIAVDGVLEDLDTLGAAASDGQFIVATGSGAFAYESGSTARTSLGLGTLATLSSISDSQVASDASIAITKLAASSITVADGSSSTAISLGNTITFSGTSNEVTVGESSGTITVGLPDDVTIAGDLTVNGDTVTVDTATLNVEDPLIKLAKNNNSSDSLDIGFYGLYDTSGSQDLYAGLFRDANDSGKFKLFKDLQAEPTTTVNVSGTGYAKATLVADLEGNVTGNASGNAGTATALATGRDISLTGDVTGTTGSVFDGTGNVSIAATIAATSVEGSMLNDNVISGQGALGSASVAQADLFMMDDGPGTLKKITFSNLEDSIFGNVSGDIAIAAGGAATIQANSVALGTDTTGNYVATVADSGTGGITVANSGSESAAVTVELDVNGLTAATLASGDFLAFSDESATGDPTKKESIDDIATLFAGAGLTASSAVINLDITGFDAIAEGALTAASDVMLVYDADAGVNKKITIEDLEDAIGGTGTVTNVVAGTGLSGGGTTTATLDLDFSELTDMTGDISGSTEFILQNGTTESRKAASEIKLSYFNNNSNWTSNAGTVTSVTVTGGNGLTGGGSAITSSGSVTLAVGSDSLAISSDKVDIAYSALSTIADDIATSDHIIFFDASNSNAVQIGTVSDLPFSNNTGDITQVAITAGNGLTGSATTNSGNHSQTLTVDYLPATDDRDVKPNAITTSGVKQVRAYFTTLEGLTGSSGSDYQDLLVLDTYSDGTGGDMNALAFDKSTQNIYHYLADQSDSTWGTAKRIAYIENGSNNRVMTASSSSTVNGEANLTFDGTDLAIAATGKIYLDGGSHTYIHEQADDILEFVVGNDILMKLTEAGSGIEFPQDSHPLKIGAGSDLQLNHNGSNSFVENYTGNLNIINNTDDGDLILSCDDGSGGVTQYIRIDGSAGLTQIDKDMKFVDSVKAQFGDSSDLQIYHDGTNSYLKVDYSSGGTTRTSEINMYDSSDGSMKFKTDNASTGGIEFWTEGSQRMEVQRDGNVGIGTSSPSYKLDITHAGSGLRLNSSADQQLRFERTSANAFSIEHDTSRMYLYNRTTSAATVAVTNAGNFGIGTVSPSVDLHVLDASGHSQLRIETDSASHGAYLELESTTNKYQIYNVGGDLGIDESGVATRLTIKDSTGNVGIGTTSPSAKLDIVATGDEGLEVTGGSGYLSAFFQTDFDTVAKFYSSDGTAQIELADNSSSSGYNTIGVQGNGAMFFKVNNSERMRIDSSGRLVVGATAAIATTGGTGASQVLGTGNSDTVFTIGRFSNNTGVGNINFLKSRNGTIGSNTIVQDGDGLGAIVWAADDGTDYVSHAAKIDARIDGTPGANDTPGRLSFYTTADGSQSAVEAMRIDKTQDAHFDQDVIAFSTTPSDIRLKKNFTKIENGLDVVNKLEGHTFNWKKGGERLSAGFKAQEVEKILPHLVDEKKLPLKADDDKEYKILRYEEMIPYLVEAIKEQQKQINKLEEKLNG